MHLYLFANFLWASYEATPASDAQRRQGYYDEGMAALRAAEGHGFLKAYIVDGLWQGEQVSLSTTFMLGDADQRSQTWPILTAVTRWSEGARKGDSGCLAIMNGIAPAWQNAQKTLVEVDTLQSAFRQKEQSGNATRQELKADMEATETRRLQWLTESQLGAPSAAGSSMQGNASWKWVNEKALALMDH